MQLIKTIKYLISNILIIVKLLKKFINFIKNFIYLIIKE
jgi:hypothetical protein